MTHNPSSSWPSGGAGSDPYASSGTGAGSGAAGQPGAYAQPGSYAQPGAYAQPGSYGQPDAYAQPGPGAYGGAYPSQPWTQQAGPAGYAQPKSRTTAALLAFFLGAFGAHNFYLGQKGRAIGHLVLVVLAVIMFFVAIAAAAGAGYDGTDSSIGEGTLAGLRLAVLAAYALAGANGIWAPVEFVMTLVSKSDRLA